MKQILPFLKNFLSFFYPALCPSCQQAMQQHEKVICLNCMLHLPETDYHTEKENPAWLLFAGRVKIERVASLLAYKKGNHVQSLLHHFKYKGDQDIGVSLGKYYGEKLIQIIDFQEIDLIIPIPLHPKKQKQRGYNQSECFAKGLSEGMQKPYSVTALTRNVFTETQTKKNRIGRWENVKSVFDISESEQIKGKNLLLCDDVLTTGATLEAAAQQLLSVEGVKIWVATLATAI